MPILHVARLRALIGPALLIAGAAYAQQGFTLQSAVGGGLLYPAPPFPLGANRVVLDDERGVAVDLAGNVYWAGGTDNVVYKESGGQITVVAGTVSTNGISNSGYSGDGGPATKALLNDPQGIAVDTAGNLYIVDSLNYVIREVAANTGTITTIAGDGSYGNPVPGPAQASGLLNPFGVAVNTGGDVFASIGLAGGYIVKIAKGTLSIVAGVGFEGSVTSGAQATTQPIVAPEYMSVDAAGNVYFSASGYVLELAVSSGALNIIAGNGNSGYSGDGASAVSAAVFPSGVAVDDSGNVYIADGGNNAIREVSNGIINTIAGQPTKIGTDCTIAAVAGTSGWVGNTSGIAFGAGKVFYGDSQGCIQALTPVLAGAPSIKSSGVVSASAFGEFSSAAPGSWIEIYGANLAEDSRPWASNDFDGSNAPTALDGTSVTIGGIPAFVDYVSAQQVDAQVPANVASGPQPVVVTTPGGAKATSTIGISQTAPGLLAPSGFNAGGRQYVAALNPNGSFVLPAGAISGVASQPANPGDTIVLYGIGFGGVTPGTPPGQIANGQSQLSSPLVVEFAGTGAKISYQGLAPGYVGLYQFDVVVPNVSSGDAVPLTFTLGGTAGTQTLYTAIR